MYKLQSHLLGFAEFHIEKNIEKSSVTDLEEITEIQLIELYSSVSNDIWGSIREYLDVHKIKVEPFLENSELLEELVRELNYFAEREKYIIENENMYIIFDGRSLVKKIMVFKNDLSYIGSYLLEHFYKNKEQLVLEFILNRTAILK